MAAIYGAAQAVIDACERLKSGLQQTDSPELYKDAIRHCDLLEAVAEKIKATGDKHDAKLRALRGGAGGDQTDADTDNDGDTDTADVSTDDDGVLKAVRPVYRAALAAARTRRFSAAEVEAARGRGRRGDADELAALAAEFAALKKLIRMAT